MASEVRTIGLAGSAHADRQSESNEPPRFGRLAARRRPRIALAMIAVIFEVEPTAEGRDPYLGLAAELRPLLDEIDGFISIERFQSLSHPERILSLSFWRDETAIEQWRQIEDHRQAQSAGRQGIFRDYRLRIAHVIRDYGLNDREQAPRDSCAYHA